MSNYNIFYYAWQTFITSHNDILSFDTDGANRILEYDVAISANPHTLLMVQNESHKMLIDLWLFLSKTRSLREKWVTASWPLWYALIFMGSVITESARWQISYTPQEESSDWLLQKTAFVPSSLLWELIEETGRTELDICTLQGLLCYISWERTSPSFYNTHTVAVVHNIISCRVPLLTSDCAVLESEDILILLQEFLYLFVHASCESQKIVCHYFVIAPHY